jgi:copper chaperone CopZ
MTTLSLSKRACGVLCPALATLGLAACGTTVSTNSFKGEEHAVAQTVANLQSDATAGEQGKICKSDLSAPVVARLGGAKGCEQAIKNQLTEIDNLELGVQSIKLNVAASSASATVKSTRAGKTTVSLLTLVKEAGKWKVAGL